jgi:hypothetical protein
MNSKQPGYILSLYALLFAQLLTATAFAAIADILSKQPERYARHA